LLDKIDYNHDGANDLQEIVRGVKANMYNPVQQEYARELLYLIKEMYNEMFATGFESVDINELWYSGNLGMRQWFSGNIVTEASNPRYGFKLGMFPFVTVTSATSRFVKDLEYTTAGPYQPDGHGFNLIKPAVEKNKAVEEAAIAWMKFFTAPENLSEVILEDPVRLGAVKGTVVPPLLEDWLSQPMPIFPNNPYFYSWPTAFTSEGHLAMGKELEMWIKGQATDAAFFRRWNELQQKSADDLIASMGINTTGW
jgi:ABC-type glycerol-3-phosphate transport system substrate-binding protein